MADFVRKDSGEPLALPSASLGPEESSECVAKAAASVNAISDEFKRFKVKAEIARKQLDAEARQV